jgi:hypothetical protein
MVRQEERPWQGRASVLLDLRQSAHELAPRGADDGAAHDFDERDRSSLEWAISAAASIGWHLMAAGRGVELISELDAPRPHSPHTPLDFVEQLAGVRANRHANLTPARAVLAAAARESALIAVLGELDPVSLRLLGECHPRGSVTPAVAVLLDTATWSGRERADGPTACQTAGRVLQASGWRVTVVRRGTGIAEAWRDTLRPDRLAGALR